MVIHLFTPPQYITPLSLHHQIGWKELIRSANMPQWWRNEFQSEYGQLNLGGELWREYSRTIKAFTLYYVVIL